MEEVLAPGALIVIIIAGNGVRQCIIINYFSLPGSISSRLFRTFFCFSDFDPRGLLEAEGRPAECSNQLRNMMIDMIIKIAINDIFNLFRAPGSVRNGFVFKYHRKWWYREVEGSFLSPFHGRFCFS